MLRVQVAGYEFELETLILALRARINIREIRISTVYERRNPSSHFNSVLDSMKIYFVFIRFVSASLASFFFPGHSRLFHILLSYRPDIPEHDHRKDR
ncbi:MAG: hypothetical protein ACUVQ6_01710, partial [Dissulfurimicrobium sp.]